MQAVLRRRFAGRQQQYPQPKDALKTVRRRTPFAQRKVLCGRRVFGQQLRPPRLSKNDTRYRRGKSFRRHRQRYVEVRARPHSRGVLHKILLCGSGRAVYRRVRPSGQRNQSRRRHHAVQEYPERDVCEGLLQENQSCHEGKRQCGQAPRNASAARL